MNEFNTIQVVNPKIVRAVKMGDGRLTFSFNPASAYSEANDVVFRYDGTQLVARDVHDDQIGFFRCPGFRVNGEPEFVAEPPPLLPEGQYGLTNPFTWEDVLSEEKKKRDHPAIYAKDGASDELKALVALMQQAGMGQQAAGLTKVPSVPSYSRQDLEKAELDEQGILDLIRFVEFNGGSRVDRTETSWQKLLYADAARLSRDEVEASRRLFEIVDNSDLRKELVPLAPTPTPTAKRRPASRKKKVATSV